MHKVSISFMLFGIYLLASCSALTPSVQEQPTPATATVTMGEGEDPLADLPGESVAAVRNSAYQLGLSDQVQVVQLVDGRYRQEEREDPGYLSVFMTDDIALGDLDGDGEEEAVALIAENYGGSGSFVFLSVFQYRGSAAQFLTSAYLDDRPIIESLSIQDGSIQVEAILHASDDPLCCPTASTKRGYRLNGNTLVLRELSTFTPAGQPRTIMIDSPGEGAEVSGIVQVTGRISIAPFENNLVYRLYDMGGVELSAGPITVEAQDMGAPGTFRKAIDLGDILTNTTLRVEVQDINVADGSLFAMDSVLLQVK